jgi:c(7)-type cytochrome triheme protein
MQAGRTPLSKEDMYGGATCGACHDGISAFAVDDVERCESCHVDEEVRP